MQKNDEEKVPLSQRNDDGGDNPEKKKKKKKSKHKKKHRKNKEADDKKNDAKDNKRSALSNDQFIINGNYNLIKMLGFGAFGEIHLAYDTNTKQLRAIKFEIASHKNPQLKHEHSIIEQLNKSDNSLNNSEGIEGIPRVYLFDKMENKYNYMVMDFLGPCWSDLFQFKEKSFSIETVLMIGIQMLSRIEFIHEKGFWHRDIKPENFVIGWNEKSNIVHMIDYGLSKRYKDKNTGQHIPYRENRHWVGTVRYASINAHLGIEQSRRDDIESIGYVLVYFFWGRLPWQSKQDKGKPPLNKIMEKKWITPPEILCKKMPMEFSYYFHYCKNLKFEDRPDYSTLKSLFADCLSTFVNKELEFVYDWFDEGKKKNKDRDKDRNHEDNRNWIGNSNNDGINENDEHEENSYEENNNQKEDGDGEGEGVTPGGDDRNKGNENMNEEISLFSQTKKGENINNKGNNVDENLKIGEAPDNQEENVAENFLNVIGKNENANKNDKDSASESDSEDTERVAKNKKKDKKSTDSNYEIIKDSESDKNKNEDAVLDVKDSDNDIKMNINK